MCGFVGIVSKGNKAFPETSLDKMTSMIAHRGPDDVGTFCHENWLAMGFRRLSILDLSLRGHQPMISGDKNHAMVFNGEVYNYCEIREELKKGGRTFTSDSDTEVVLQAYQQWGRNCVDKFVGMFSFVIADLNKKTIFAARDQLGIKPLFVFEDENYYIFCSEIKSLLPYCQLEPDFHSLNEYLVFRSVIGARTLFKNVTNVLPGHSVDIKNGLIEFKNYFNLSDTLNPDYSRSFEENCDLVENSLQESIKLHLRSDVELGVQLSGGVDSSLITAMASQQVGKRFHSFSISFDDPACDESKYQKYVSERYNTEHHNYSVDNDIFSDMFQKSIWHYEHPLNDPNAVPTFYLAKKAKEYVKVILAGEGADEAFMGYSRFKRHCISTLKKRSFLYRCPALRETISRLWPIRKGKDLFNILRYNPAMFVLTYSDLNLVDKLLKGDVSGMEYRLEASKSANRVTLNEAILQDQMCDLPQWFQRADRMGMGASLELRVPFCTVPMFSLANSIPYEQRVYQGVRKGVLKKVAGKYLDHEQIYRKKIGFGLPIDKWSRSAKGYGAIIQETFESYKFRSRDFINREHFDSTYNSFKSGQYSENNCGFLWTYCNLENWYRIFFENGWKKFQ